MQQQSKSLDEDIREAVVAEVSRREWLYVGLVDTDFKHFEDEEQYIRADGAVDALLELAHKQGLSNELSGAEAEGKQRLRDHMLDRKENGPARLMEVRAHLGRIEHEVPMHEYHRDSAEREARGYYELRTEKLAIEGDLEIADLALSYLDGEDIEGG